ncbi:MAG: hypothetical protein GKC05_04680 [Methanomicrobiales archaeon]|nr:hypothetical protein [Methanomicrobiales archaeon]
MRTRRLPSEKLRSVRDADWVDRSRRPYVSQGTAYIPVKEGYFWDTELSPKILYRGRGFFMAGTIAIYRDRSD